VYQIGEVSDLSSIDARYVAAVGWPEGRRTLVERISDSATPADAIVHPVADIGVGVELAPGTVVLGGAHLSPVRAPRRPQPGVLRRDGRPRHRLRRLRQRHANAAVSGDVTAGDEVLVGTGACVLEGLRLGHRAQVERGPWS